MENKFNPSEEDKIKFNITDSMLKYSENRCRCPFCFGIFTPLTAAFRVAPESVCSNQAYEILTGEEKQSAQPYREMQDKIYENFWRKFPGSEPNDASSKEIAKRPAMHMLLENHLRGKFVADAEDFPIGMVDNKGNRSDVRICPHCHNQIPLNFGKYPVKYIALVGITSSGKTVFLSQLLKELFIHLNNIGFELVYGMAQIKSFCEMNPIRKGEKLPKGNTPDKLTTPIAVTVQNKETKKIYTLVFYDIAGENCVDADKMKKFGPFIVNSDGIIMIVDPAQFPELLGKSNNTNRVTVSPLDMIEKMYEAFVAEKCIEGQSELPVAVAISKSDELKPLFDREKRNTYISYNIQYDQYVLKGFPFKEYCDINEEIRTLLSSTGSSKAFVSRIESSFKENGFFAFSALNTKPIETVDDKTEDKYFIIEEDPETVRIEEAFNWMLYQFKMLNKASKDERRTRRFLGIF